MLESVDNITIQVGKLAGLLDGVARVKKLASQVAPEGLSPSPSDSEVKQYLEMGATPEGACRIAHEGGWQKGFLMGGAVVLVGAAIVLFALGKR